MGHARGSTLTVATLALVGAIGCATPSATEPGETIVGTWAWVRAEGGIAGEVRTPATEGFERTLVLSASGLAILYQDGEEVARTGYELGIGAPGTTHDGETIVRWDVPPFGFEEQALGFPALDVMVLDDGCCDGFRWTFGRVEAS